MHGRVWYDAKQAAGDCHEQNVAKDFSREAQRLYLPGNLQNARRALQPSSRYFVPETAFHRKSTWRTAEEFMGIRRPAITAIAAVAGRVTVTQRDGTSYNESISMAGNATAQSSSGLFAEPPIPDWRRKQERLNWHHAQNFDGVAAAPAQSISAAPAVRSGVVGRTFHESVNFAGDVQINCVSTRLRESPLSWRRRWQIIRSFFRRKER
jgi:hypothetical protein